MASAVTTISTATVPFDTVSTPDSRTNGSRTNGWRTRAITVEHLIARDIEEYSRRQGVNASA